MPTIAIIEDDEILNNHFRNLVETLPNVTVNQFFDRLSAENAVSTNQFDLVILDIELGEGPKDKFGGLNILSELKGRRTVTIVVSGISEDSIPKIVLTLRAYDFISKPVEDLNFINKVEHALQSQLPETEEAKEANKGKVWPTNLTPDPDHNPGFRWKGQRIRLSITEFRIINCLIASPGVSVKKSLLAKQLETSNAQSAIAVHISGIRSKFIDIDPTFNSIQVDPGVGYVWNS